MLKSAGRFAGCPICFNARRPDESDLVTSAKLGDTIPMREWIGDESATTFSY